MKIAVAISGASGSIYAKILLEQLQHYIDEQLIERVELVWSENAFTVWREELGNDDYKNFSFKNWGLKDFYAPFASGSAGFDALVIVPCSMGTLGRIATGISDNLITRSADVMLKERKKLVCVIRETPYSLIHINNMKLVTEAGGIICPATPSFYSKPQTMVDAVMTVINRILQLLGLPNKGYKWGS